MKSTFATELFVKLFGVMPPTKGKKNQPQAPKTEVMVPNRSAEPGGKVIYHVTPRRKDDRWNIKKEGASRPSAVCDTKQEAIERARELAQSQGWSQVVIHNKDGKIAQEFSYGERPGDGAKSSSKPKPVDDVSDERPEETESDDGFVDDYEGDDVEDEGSYQPKSGERVIYHVTPRKKDGRWNIRRRGAERPSKVEENKEPAIEQAKVFAKKHPWSQVIIHNTDGKIANEYVYGGPTEAAGTKRPTAKIDKDEPAPGRKTSKQRTDKQAPKRKTTRRVVYHVTPRQEDGKWRVKRAGSQKPTRVLDKKTDAIQAAKELAKNQQSGQVVIHKKDGKIAEEFKYDN